MVTRFPAACVLVESDGPRDDRVIMSVADGVQLDFLVVSCECVSEMTAGVGHEPAGFAVLVQPRIVSSREPVNVVVRKAVVSERVSNNIRAATDVGLLTCLHR